MTLAEFDRSRSTLGNRISLPRHITDIKSTIIDGYVRARVVQPRSRCGTWRLDEDTQRMNEIAQRGKVERGQTLSFSSAG